MKKPPAGSVCSMLPYLAVVAAVFWLVPLALLPAGAEAAMWLLAGTLLLLNPIVCFTASYLYGLRCGFGWLLPLLDGAVFLPTIFVFYNYTAFAYVISYIAAAFLGAGAAAAARKGRRDSR